MKQIYELTIVFPEDKEGKLKKSVIKLIEDFAKSSKGEVMKHESWGVKTLAYPIKKNTTGEYEHFVLDLDKEKQPKLDEELRLTEGLLRYLFVRV